jgi:hypothetical protein
MARIKILFADDQIPDDHIPDDLIRETLSNLNPHWSPGFINAFVAMRKAVKTLRSENYEVTVARSYAEGISLIDTMRFDIAIVDLGWFADEDLAPHQQDYAGWNICDAIDIADKKRGTSHTPQIVYSNRFEKDPGLSVRAANLGKLPVFKNYSEANQQVLKASVKFVETLLTSQSPLEQLEIKNANDFQQMMVNSLNESLAQQKHWGNLTLVFVGLSLLLIIFGAVFAIFGNTQIGTVSTISS